MNKLLNSSLSFIIISTLLIVFSGCMKDDLKYNRISDLNIRTNIQPVVENGTLKFNSLQDSYIYMESLTNALKVIRNSIDSSESYMNPAISVNNDIKTLTGFTSLFDSSPKDIDGNLINPIFPDEIFNMMLNSNYEIIINDKIYVHKNNFEYYVISVNDIQNRDLLRNVSAGGRLDLKYLNTGVQVFGSKIETRSPCDCTFELRRVENHNTNKHEFILRYWCSDAFDGQSFTMKWISKDGSISNTISGIIDNSDISINNPHPREILFDLPLNVLEFEIEFCVETDCGDGLIVNCYKIPFSIDSECCQKLDIIETKELLYSNEGYKLVATYKNGLNFWGYYHYGHLAFIRLSDKAKLKAKRLEILFDVTYRNSNKVFPPCEGYSETDRDDCTNCKWISENVYDDGTHLFHKHGDVKLNYIGKRGTTTGSIQLMPEFCF